MDDKIFTASSGWLTRFKNRYGIKFKTICGEGGKVREEDCSNWNNVILPEILDTYSPDDIYNADETALFYKMLPHKTMAMRGDKCIGGKSSIDRLSILVASNSSGSDKLELLVIGKSVKPRCFKNVKNLPCTYKANKKAWMTTRIFDEWLVKLDKKMYLCNRKIALIIDNCTSHKCLSELKAIKLYFLPPNTTSSTQPMDMGIIANLKSIYRRIILRKRILDLECNKENTINVLDSLFYISEAWNKVSSDTISNCFAHCNVVDRYTDDDTIIMENLDDLYERLKELNDDIVLDKDEYINYDKCVATSYPITDNYTNDVDDELDISDIEDEDISNYIPSKNDALNALHCLRHYFVLHDTLSTNNNISFLNNVLDTVNNTSLVHKIITSYFTK